jgi:hypothetical protein
MADPEVTEPAPNFLVKFLMTLTVRGMYESGAMALEKAATILDDAEWRAMDESDRNTQEELLNTINRLSISLSSIQASLP